MEHQAAIHVAGDVLLRPPLKWAGGKRWQVPQLIDIWNRHRHRRLVEPFCGGLAVTLGLMPETALLNDVNPHVVNLYRWLGRGLRITLAMQNASTPYYASRQRFNDLLQAGGADTAEAASLFYYLNRTGYNGLCRFNASGEFNVPFGSYKRINYRREFADVAAQIAGWEFSTGSFEERRVISVPQSLAASSTLRPILRSSSCVTRACELTIGWSVAVIRTIFSPL